MDAQQETLRVDVAGIVAVLMYAAYIRACLEMVDPPLADVLQQVGEMEALLNGWLEMKANG